MTTYQITLCIFWAVAIGGIGGILGLEAAKLFDRGQLKSKDEQLKGMLELLDKSTTTNNQLISQNEFLLRFTLKEFSDEGDDDDDDDDDDGGGEEIKEFNLRNN